MSITNLTGYSWRPNDTLNWGTSALTEYSVNIAKTKHSSAGTTLKIGKNSYGSNKLFINGGTLYNSEDGGWYEYDDISRHSLSVKPAYFYFTGGTDATNTTLISLLEANGTLTSRAANLGNFLTDIADEARDAYGTSAEINAQNFPELLYSKSATITATNPNIGTPGSALGLDATYSNGIWIESEASVSVTNGYISRWGGHSEQTFSSYIKTLNIPSGRSLLSFSNSGTVNSSTNASGATLSSFLNSGSINSATNASGATISSFSNYGEVTSMTNADGASLSLINRSNVLCQVFNHQYIDLFRNTPESGVEGSGYVEMVDNTADGDICEIDNNGLVEYIYNGPSAEISDITSRGSIGTITNSTSTAAGSSTISTIDNGSATYAGEITDINNNSRGIIDNITSDGVIYKITNGISGGAHGEIDDITNYYDIIGLFNYSGASIDSMYNEGTIGTLTNDSQIDELDGSGTISKFCGTSTSTPANQYIAELGSYTSSSSYANGNLLIKKITGTMGTSYGHIYIGTDITGPTDSANASLDIYDQMYSTTEASDYLSLKINSGKKLMCSYNYGTIGTLNNNTGATITSLYNAATISSFSNGSAGSIDYFSNSGTVSSSRAGSNSGSIGSSSYPIANTGTIYLSHGTSGKGDVYVTPYGGSLTKVISIGNLVSPISWSTTTTSKTAYITVTPSYSSNKYAYPANSGWFLSSKAVEVGKAFPVSSAVTLSRGSTSYRYIHTSTSVASSATFTSCATATTSNFCSAKPSIAANTPTSLGYLSGSSSTYSTTIVWRPTGGTAFSSGNQISVMFYNSSTAASSYDYSTTYTITSSCKFVMCYIMYQSTTSYYCYFVEIS